jgi:hypothetical protein
VKAVNPTSAQENIKFTEEISMITYKQAENLQNIHKTEPHSKVIRNTWEGM